MIPSGTNRVLMTGETAVALAAIVAMGLMASACRASEPAPPPPGVDGAETEESKSAAEGADAAVGSAESPSEPDAVEEGEKIEKTNDGGEPAIDPDPPAAEGWRAITLIEGLEHPWGLAFLPNGDMLITERPGRLRLVRDGSLLEQPVKGTPQVFARGQGGLLDVALHPDFEENSLVYLTHSTGTSRANRTALSRGRLDDGRLTDVELLFEAQPAKSGGEHFGSRILWLPDGTLLMSIGDGGNPPRRIDGILARDHGQRLDSHLGSIVRLDEDGEAPDDNPLRDREEALPELFTYGHRNIQGMALHPSTGRVWANEHGPYGGDELNLIRPGENYGWPIATYGADYRTRERFTPHETLPYTVAPKAVWTPAQAPSGLALYDDERFPRWRGDLFSGGLVGRQVRRIILDGEQVAGQEQLPIGERVRLVVQGPGGYLYVLTDERDGKLIRIEPE